MTIHLVHLADAAAQAWRNGGGRTRELLAWPTADAWQLRVSVADIARDGPFSNFPGVQRWFAVLEGAGVMLALPDADVQLTGHSPPCCFDGEAAPGCRLLAGPTRDLNLMSLRQHGQGLMRRALPGEPLRAGPAWRGLFNVEGVTLRTGTEETALPPFTLAWSTQSAGDWQVIHDASLAADADAAAGAARAWWLSFTRAPQPSETPT